MRIDEFSQRKIVRSIVEIIIYYAIVAVGFIALLYRLRYGIDFTDESWYVAEPYIVANGATPYLNNWTQAPGFTIPLALLYKIFVIISGGTEGIVLFSRVLYAFSVLTVGVIVGVILKKQFHNSIVVLLAFPLFFATTYSLYDLSYDSMGILYLLLGTVILFGCEKKEHFAAFLAGVIMARAVIASPSVLLGWAGCLVALSIYHLWKKLFLFIGGNIFSAALVVGWCSIRGGGIQKFIEGLIIFFTKTAYFRIHRMHTFTDDMVYLFLHCLPAVFTVFLIILCKALVVFMKKHLNILRCQKAIVYDNLIPLICLLALMIGTIFSVCLFDYTVFIQFAWFEGILLLLQRDIDKKEKDNYRILGWISLLFVGVYILNSSSNVYGFGGREYWLIVPVMMSIFSVGMTFEKKVAVKAVSLTCIIVFGLLLLRHNYEYVYRDLDINQLVKCVERGIWKGCYTTEERAENVMALEDYIKDVTVQGEEVLFLDQVPFAYLMSNGRPCTSTSADPMTYTYDAYTDILFDYFTITDKEPNKIIYIDFGRDKNLSIDSNWGFNAFVNKNYDLKEEYYTDPEDKTRNDRQSDSKYSFKIKCYVRK